jgi:hypothetical protein
MFPQRDLDILSDCLVAEQCTVLEQHAPSDLHPDQRVAVDVGHILAEHFDPATSWPLLSDHRTEKNGFAGTGTADHAHDLPPNHVKIEMVVQNAPTKPRQQPANMDYWRS